LGTVQKRELLPEYDQVPVIEEDVQRQVERL